MARLDVQAVWNVSSYVQGEADILVISTLVTDASGNPVENLPKESFSLFNDGNLLGELAYVSQGTLMMNVGLYDLTFESFPPPSHFENGSGAVIVTVTNGADRGQTIINVTVEGRPVPEEND